MTPNGSGDTDFDFFLGNWRVKHRRLKERLVGCNEWVEFAGTCLTQPILGGLGNIDDNVLDLPFGMYRAVTLRSFDAKTGTWSIWWLDGRNPSRLDPPMVGRFKDGVGTFYAEDTLDGRPIHVRFQWTLPERDAPRWEQAFSSDAGHTWETNWIMDFVRAS
jgi:hypothetical protein